MITGDSGCEAYTAIAWGVGLSHERSDIAGAEGFYSLEGNMCGTVTRGADALPGSKATSRATRSHRKLGDRCRPASGRRGAVADDARTREVGPRHSSDEAGEQSGTARSGRNRWGAIRSGAGGAKGGDQGECGPAKHEPDAEPDERVTGAGTHTKVANDRKKERFTALFHHISTELLEEAFYELAQNAAPGVDRLTWKDYEADLERNIEDLHDRVQRGAYRALPSRRVYIPKPDGRQRPLAVAALEDKIVQRAVVALLNARYTRRTSSGSRMDPAQGAVRTMRSMRSVSASTARK